MGKRRSPMLQRVSNIINISIFIAKMRLVYLKKSTNLSKFKVLKKRYNSYGFLQERQFSPSSTPLIRFRSKKTNNGSYSICFLSCFRGRCDYNKYGVMVDENYSIESALPLVEVERSCMELMPSEEEEEADSVDERAERFIERFYEEMKRQRRESLSSSANLPLNRMLEF